MFSGCPSVCVRPFKHLQLAETDALIPTSHCESKRFLCLFTFLIKFANYRFIVKTLSPADSRENFLCISDRYVHVACFHCVASLPCEILQRNGILSL